MDSGQGPQSSVSQKNQEVVDLYDNYVAGGFAPYPVCLAPPLLKAMLTPVRCPDSPRQGARIQSMGRRREGVHRLSVHVLSDKLWPQSSQDCRRRYKGRV